MQIRTAQEIINETRPQYYATKLGAREVEAVKAANNLTNAVFVVLTYDDKWHLINTEDIQLTEEDAREAYKVKAQRERYTALHMAARMIERNAPELLTPELRAYLK